MEGRDGSVKPSESVADPSSCGAVLGTMLGVVSTGVPSTIVLPSSSTGLGPIGMPSSCPSPGNVPTMMGSAGPTTTSPFRSSTSTD
jgi:hypothetical protein